MTFVTWRRQPWFAQREHAITASEALLARHTWRRSKLLAWVLMPDHWHGLIELGDGEDLASLLRELKATSATTFRRRHDWPYRVWADGYHDRALRHDDDLLAAARYLVLNPFRAGLVRRIRNYPFWGAIWARDAES